MTADACCDTPNIDAYDLYTEEKKVMQIVCIPDMLLFPQVTSHFSLPFKYNNIMLGFYLRCQVSAHKIIWLLTEAVVS